MRVCRRGKILRPTSSKRVPVRKSQCANATRNDPTADVASFLIFACAREWSDDNIVRILKYGMLLQFKYVKWATGIRSLELQIASNRHGTSKRVVAPVKRTGVISECQRQLHG